MCDVNEVKKLSQFYLFTILKVGSIVDLHVVLISGVTQSDSVIYIYFFQILFH